MHTRVIRNYKSLFVESRFTSFLILAIIVIIRIFMYMKNGLPDFQIIDRGFVWKYIETIFLQFPLVSVLASTFSVFVIGYLISELNVRYGVIRTRTTIPFYLPLIFFSVHPFFLKMTPDFVSAIFILGALFPLLASYQNSRPGRLAFQFTVFIAIAGVFQVHALLLLPLFWIGLAIMGATSFRTFMASLSGIVLVFWIVFSLYVFGDNIAGFIAPFLSIADIYDFTQIPAFSIPQWGFFATAILLIIMAIIADGRQMYKDRSFTKKVLFFIIAAIIFTLLMQVLYLGKTFLWIYAFLAFFSIVVTHLYSNIVSKLGVYSFYTMLALLLCYYCLNLFTNLSPF